MPQTPHPRTRAPAHLVVLRLRFVSEEDLDRGEPLHAVLSAQLLVLVGVDLRHLDGRVDGLGHLLPLHARVHECMHACTRARAHARTHAAPGHMQWKSTRTNLGENGLAVAAPRRIEEHHPDILAVDDRLLEVFRRQLLHLGVRHVQQQCGKHQQAPQPHAWHRDCRARSSAKWNDDVICSWVRPTNHSHELRARSGASTWRRGLGSGRRWWRWRPTAAGSFRWRRVS